VEDGACLRGDDADALRKRGQRTLARRVEQPFFFKLGP
jgi:hypothetical protein